MVIAKALSPNDPLHWVKVTTVKPISPKMVSGIFETGKLPLGVYKLLEEDQKPTSAIPVFDGSALLFW